MERNYFSDNIKYLRKVYKIKQNEFAKIFGKTQSTISMWESGERDATLGDVIEISNYFKIEGIDLITKDLSVHYSESVQNSMEKELLFAFRNIPEEQQQAVLTLVKGMAKV